MTPLEILAEVDAHGFEDTDITRKLNALNFAIKNIAQRKAWPFLEKVTTLAFDGTNPYPTVGSTPTDLRAVMKLMNTSTGRRIRYVPVADVEEQLAANMLDAGEPVLYYFEGTQLRVYKVPSASTTLRLRYLRTAPKVLDSDPENAIIIPVDGHEAIVFRMLMRLYDLEDDPEMSARFEAHYENEMAQITDALMALQHDSPEYIHVIDVDEWSYE